MAALPTVGCYRYVPNAAHTPGVGQTVRVRLTLDGTRELASQLGPEVRTVLGRVDGVAGDSIRLQVQESRTLSGQVLLSRGNTVSIARGYLAETEERTPNKRRSVMTAALAVVGSALLIVVMKGAAGGGGGTPAGGGPPPA